MKILEKVQAIFNQYKLNPVILPEDYKNIYTYLREHPEFKGSYETDKDDVYFLKKYRNNIAKGHYGFAIGDPIIPAWNQILDEILELCIVSDPNFEIMQIKIKFGGIRFYVYSEIIEDIHDVEMLIDSTLFDKVLIY
jgi:hypothetical protein